MNKKCLFFVVISFFFFTAFCVTQTTVTVTDIKAVQSNNIVTLTWKNPRERTSFLYIYRHTEAISQKNIVHADYIGRTAGTETSFTDEPHGAHEFFYAVLTSDSNPVPIAPFNATIIPVIGSSEAPQIPTTQISTLQAIVKEQSVIITYISTIKNKMLTLYRSTSPFADVSSLSNAVVIQTFVDKGSPYIDYPIPEVPYYYALVDEDTFKTGEIFFLKDKNTTSVPVSVSITYANVSTKTPVPIRPIPLPLLASEYTPRYPYPFAADTTTIISKLTKNVLALEVPLLQSYVFPIDKTQASLGEAYMLHRILNSSFAEENWKVSEEELRKFLSVRRTEETTARAYFYLGEALYFLGDYSGALFNFLLAQDVYFAQSQKWLQNILQRL